MTFPQFVAEPPVSVFANANEGESTLSTHRCTGFPLVLEAVIYDRATKKCKLMNVQAQAQTISDGTVMNVCVGRALDCTVPICSLLGVEAMDGTDTFALLSTDFASVSSTGVFGTKYSLTAFCCRDRL